MKYVGKVVFTVLVNYPRLNLKDIIAYLFTGERKIQMLIKVHSYGRCSYKIYLNSALTHQMSQCIGLKDTRVPK